MFNIELGKFLAKLRTEKNITQEQLANQLHIDKRKVSRWECGVSPPDFDLLIKLTEIFNITLYELSICKRLEDEKLIEKAKKKFKTIKDLKKFNIKKKISLIIAILLGIFFGICTIFTLNNYDTVEIYTLMSLDENFAIGGSYIKAKDYSIFNVTKLGCKNSDNNGELNIKISDINFEVFDNESTRFSLAPNMIGKENLTLLQKINSASFSKEKLEGEIDENKQLFFQINYRDMNNDIQSLTFEFKLIKKFENSV